MTQNAAVKEIIKETWGILPIEKIVEKCAMIDPDMDRVRLVNIAHRMREQGAIPANRKYRERTVTLVWSREDEATLRQMAGNAPVQDIARALGTTVGAIRQKASALQISIAYNRDAPRPLNARELELARAFASQAGSMGLSVNRMAYAVRVAAGA